MPAYFSAELCWLIRLVNFDDRSLGEDEISNTQDPMVLFRGNTVATKCIDEFMKIAGGHYLHYTLK